MNVLLAQLGRWSAVGIALAFFGFLLAQRLTKAKYSTAWSFALGGVALAPCIVAKPAELPLSLLFAFSIYCVASAVVNFGMWQNPRRIIVLGSSLACAEIVSPASGILTAVLLPFVLQNPDLRQDPQRTIGLFVLLLFIPVLAGAVLLYMWLALHTTTSRLLDSADGVSGHQATEWIASLLAVVSILPALFRSRTANALSTGAVGWIVSTFALGTLLASLLGTGHHSMGLLIATGPLITVLVSSWPMVHSRLSDAVAVSVSGLVLTWAAAWLLRFPLA